MAALALAPLAAKVAGPAVASLVGPEAAKFLTPMAKMGLEKLVKSKAVGKGIRKLGNALFGKKKGKSARKLLKKGRSIAGVASGKNNILGKGLDLAGDLGMLDKNQREAIKTGHEKAMSFHDQLSSMNDPEKVSKMDYSKMNDEEEEGFDEDSGSGDWVLKYNSPGWDERYEADSKQKVLDKLSSIVSVESKQFKEGTDAGTVDPLFMIESKEYLTSNYGVKKGLTENDFDDLFKILYPRGNYSFKINKK